MNRLFILVALVGLLVVLPVTASAAPLDHTGQHDVGALMEQADRVWDLADHDAVILLEQVAYTWLADGRVREQHHRLVWISTDHTLDAFADLRVPWDSDHQTLTVEALRVLRDGRWIDARPTAVVETTPGVFRSAPDYTGIRETMLLHDGVELPCILECDYVIEDKTPFRSGLEGQWIFAQDEPTLDCLVVLETPENTPLMVAVPEGVASSVDGGRRTFQMTNLEPAPSPATDDPAAHLPHVQWSTYPGWPALGEAISEGFNAGLVLDDALRDSLETVLADRYSDLDRAHAVIDFVTRSQRRLNYDSSFFVNRVRRADRTFDTGYGVDMDLAILAGALLREIGFEAVPAFVGLGFGEVDEGVATLARFGGPGLWVRKDGMEAYYRPATGTLYAGLSPAHERTIWAPGGGRVPRTWGAHDEPTQVVAGLDLTYNAEDKQWTGSGYFEASGGLSPYDGMEGRGDGTRSRLNRALAGVFAGMTVDSFSPVEFAPDAVSAHVAVTAPAADRDELERLPVVMGAPAGGILQALPHDAHLYLAERGSPILMGAAPEQTVTVTLTLGDLEVVHLPSPVVVENAAGRFELTTKQDGNRVTMTRTIRLAQAEYPAEDWPALRAILTAETHAANRTLLLK